MAKGSLLDDALVQGEHNRCPHCGGITRALPHDELRWVCGVCGGPLVPLDPGDELTLLAKDALREAHEARGAATAWRLVAWATGFGAALGLGLGAVLAWASLGAAIGPAIAGALLAVLALRFAGRGAKRRESARAAWERAWAAEVDELLVGGSLTPAEIARKVKVPESEIGAIVARLSAEDRVRVDVGDDAQLHVTSRARIEPAAQGETLDEAPAPAEPKVEKAP